VAHPWSCAAASASQRPRPASPPSPVAPTSWPRPPPPSALTPPRTPAAHPAASPPAALAPSAALGTTPPHSSSCSPTAAAPRCKAPPCPCARRRPPCGPRTTAELAGRQVGARSSRRQRPSARMAAGPRPPAPPARAPPSRAVCREGKEASVGGARRTQRGKHFFFHSSCPSSSQND
jgi:hypothetical protein